VSADNQVGSAAVTTQANRVGFFYSQILELTVSTKKNKKGKFSNATVAIRLVSSNPKFLTNVSKVKWIKYRLRETVI
jgi:hypothetical protein